MHRMTVFSCAFMAVLFFAAQSSVAQLSNSSSKNLIYEAGSTKKVCQLTGDFDRETKTPTLSQTNKRFGVFATDLGSSFEHKGKLYFLFGDTHGRPGDHDSVAWTEAKEPDKIKLDFFKADDGKWLPPTIEGISQKGFEIPSGGISIGETIYIVYTTDHSPKKAMGRSIVASSIDDGRTFKMLYDLSRDKFINVSMIRVDEWIYIYGSGEYRRSSVSLARTKPEDLDKKGKFEYFTGQSKSEKPNWSPNEADAVPLFKHDVVGEFSVAYLEPVKRYVMLYNSGSPRGIAMRSAIDPLGPWSEVITIFDPFRGGYGKFMHMPPIAGRKYDDLAINADQEKVPGGEYGPYIMNRYTSGADGKCRIYFTMSTWNPYQVVVLQADLKLENSP